MADNLKQLTQNVDTAIPINGGVASVKTVNHNPLEKNIIEKVGKKTGFPFLAGRSPVNSVVPSGSLFFMGVALNTTTNFDVILSRKTLDGNDITRVLDLLGEGALVHFKDHVGRSVTFRFISYYIETSTGTPFPVMTLQGFAENTDYAYQIGEFENCMIEFVNTTSATVSEPDYFKDVDVDIFTKNVRAISGEDNNDNDQIRELIKEFAVSSLGSSESEVVYYQTRCDYLGVKVKGLDLIKGLKPQLIIERYTPRSRAGQTGNWYESPSNYKRQHANFIDGVESYRCAGSPPETLERRVVFPVNNERDYYNMNVQHYFQTGTEDPKQFDSQFRRDNELYKPLGSGKKSFHTPRGIRQENVWDMYGKRVRIMHLKGFAHFRIRLEVTDNNGTFVSKPLMYFKAIKELNVLRTINQPFYENEPNAYNMITFQPE